MDVEDKFIAKVFGVQSLSSSVQSTPDKNGDVDDASRSLELIQEFLRSGAKKNLFRTCFDKEKKYLATPKPKMAEQPSKTIKKAFTNQDPRKASSSKDQSSSRRNRKLENPIRIPPSKEKSSNSGNPSPQVCKNSACKAVLSMCDSYCKRCSCYICKNFDENKDPSLWLVCTSEYDGVDSCGLSCHIECAFQKDKAGVVDLGQSMKLDGSFCCAACGKVSTLLGYWKKQLIIAKEARCIDVVCQKISLSYRLLDGTSKFKELHEFVRNARAKLELEVGPVDGISAKLGRGLFSRLSIKGDLLKLFSLAIGKADEWLATCSNTRPSSRACRLLFEEVTSSSLVIVLIESPSSSSDGIKGYKLWYCKSKDEAHLKEPLCILPRDQKRFLISNLHPCMEYSFRIVPYTEAGDLGCSEAKCITKSLNSDNDIKGPTLSARGDSSSGFEFGDFRNLLNLARVAQEHSCSEGFCGLDIERRGEIGDNRGESDSPKRDNSVCVSLGLDLNVASVPDLNEELTPLLESSRKEDNGFILGHRDDDAVSHDINENALVTRGPTGEVPAVGFEGVGTGRKRAASASLKMSEYVGTTVNRTSDGLGCLDENYEYSVKTIRGLECGGHIKEEFRRKFLTWFSLRSTEQERRVVNTFIQTLVDDPVSLAGQLVDSFSDIVYSKKARTSAVL